MEQSLRRLRTDHVDVLQIHHQLGPEGGRYLAAVGPPPRYAYRLNREQGRAIEIARRHEIGIICIRAHAAGALTDTLDRDVAPDSEVARDFARGRRFVHSKQGARATLSQAALRFCLDDPRIATVVPGFKNVAELEESAACSGHPS